MSPSMGSFVMAFVSLLRAGSAAALLATALPAAAQTQAPTQAAPTKNTDPSRIICEKQQETGSRLNSKKICMTAAQWEEQRRRDRESLQDAQQRSLEPNSG